MPLPCRIPDQDFIRTERVYFPLAEDGETADTLLVLNGYPNDGEHNLDDQLPPLPEIDDPRRS